ncbi:hypothetical protein M5D96_013309 [Drosophila gunungcola]|uniref:Uncharacterized protein n=1 Tax=Drosophila gunungcola TaxID=103775 RepID=A0A9Q0BJH8_9MUSC|nr:hypothetical protein M5D96_013309 [Drosophila gunungcola]
MTEPESAPCKFCSQNHNTFLLDLGHKITPTYTGILALFRNFGGLHCKPVITTQSVSLPCRPFWQMSRSHYGCPAELMFINFN